MCVCVYRLCAHVISNTDTHRQYVEGCAHTFRGNIYMHIYANAKITHKHACICLSIDIGTQMCTRVHKYIHRNTHACICVLKKKNL